ncbi:stage III sporulation protein SpoIIIAB [Paludifilum halophilum]|uniref:stage III sporulation protein SpoIIIAB n=1 Tax=Paludifilum halophilum TaxID=1642702 RepID=UPI00146E06E6|nr:stage III sporulation protein SpoIIIAB [Paludifilum halophilum]
MIKLLGAALILLSTSIIGFRTAKSFADRPRQIRRLRTSLSLLETEIIYGSRRLDQVCEHIARREKKPIGILYQRCTEYLKGLDGVSTYECWKKAVDEVWPETAMKAPEREVLIDFGKTLGISNREDQLANLARVKSNLQVEENQAREEQTRYEKMCKSLGILAGALIVILIY